MASRVGEWEEAKKARDHWLELTFFGGVIGIITIIANLPSLDSLKTHQGAQIAIIFYIFFILICLYKVTKHQRKMKEIAGRMT